jgi:hypothetical protein
MLNPKIHRCLQTLVFCIVTYSQIWEYIAGIDFSIMKEQTRSFHGRQQHCSVILIAPCRLRPGGQELPPFYCAAAFCIIANKILLMKL